MKLSGEFNGNQVESQKKNPNQVFLPLAPLLFFTEYFIWEKLQGVAYIPYKASALLALEIEDQYKKG